MRIAHKLSIVALAVLTLPAFAQKPEKAEWNVREHLKPSEIVVQSHRGAGDLAEENTIHAFKLGWSLNTYPECDVRTTTDGVIVAFHDANFKRVVKGASPELQKKGVEDLTWAELSKLDVGAWKGDKFEGRHVDTMDEILAETAKDPNRHLFMDIKKVDFDKLAELVHKHGVEKQVIFTSPRQDELVYWRKIVPGSETLMWIGGKTGEEQMKKFNDAKARNFEGVTILQIHNHMKTKQSDVNKVTRESVDPFTVPDKFMIEAGDILRKHGILYQTLPWEADTPKVYWKLMDLGVMAFATDHPDVTLKAIEDYYKLDDSKAAKSDAATSVAKTKNDKGQDK